MWEERRSFAGTQDDKVGGMTGLFQDDKNEGGASGSLCSFWHDMDAWDPGQARMTRLRSCGATEGQSCY